MIRRIKDYFEYRKYLKRLEAMRNSTFIIVRR